jgi:ABC-2 type transport system ATP-binding protein
VSAAVAASEAQAAPDLAVDVRGLDKSYGDKHVVQDL